MQNDTWYILMDGLSINADQEPHFVKIDVIEDDFELPEIDAEAISEVEDAVNDGEPTDDIAGKLADNKDLVDEVLDDMDDEEEYVPTEEDKVHFLSFKLPKFVNLPPTGEDWLVVAGMVMNEDTDYDFTGLAYYQIEGEFKELDEASNIATKVILDGIE